MHREFTTAYTQVSARALCKDGWRAMNERDRSVIEGRTLKLRPDWCGGMTDDFIARMVRDIKEFSDAPQSRPTPALRGAPSRRSQGRGKRKA